jgi:hypothetical protein
MVTLPSRTFSVRSCGGRRRSGTSSTPAFIRPGISVHDHQAHELAAGRQERRVILDTLPDRLTLARQQKMPTPTSCSSSSPTRSPGARPSPRPCAPAPPASTRICGSTPGTTQPPSLVATLRSHHAGKRHASICFWMSMLAEVTAVLVDPACAQCQPCRAERAACSYYEGASPDQSLLDSGKHERQASAHWPALAASCGEPAVVCLSCSLMCSACAMDVQRPERWCYPTQCIPTHPWAPGTITVGWA